MKSRDMHVGEAYYVTYENRWETECVEKPETCKYILLDSKPNWKEQGHIWQSRDSELPFETESGTVMLPNNVVHEAHGGMLMRRTLADGHVQNSIVPLAHIRGEYEPIAEKVHKNWEMNAERNRQWVLKNKQDEAAAALLKQTFERHGFTLDIKHGFGAYVSYRDLEKLAALLESKETANV